MKTAGTFLMSLLVAGALTFTACDADADIEVDEKDDSVGVNMDGTADTVGNAVDNATGEVGDEMVEKAVETKLVAEPGFENVDVESKAGGVIVLTGTAATDAEKMKAEEIAKGTDGVTSVENNITVGAAQ
jgi:hypothetical protein